MIWDDHRSRHGGLTALDWSRGSGRGLVTDRMSVRRHGTGDPSEPSRPGRVMFRVRAATLLRDGRGLILGRKMMALSWPIASASVHSRELLSAWASAWDDAVAIQGAQSHARAPLSRHVAHAPAGEGRGLAIQSQSMRAATWPVTGAGSALETESRFSRLSRLWSWPHTGS